MASGSAIGRDSEIVITSPAADHDSVAVFATRSATSAIDPRRIANPPRAALRAVTIPSALVRQRLLATRRAAAERLTSGGILSDRFRCGNARSR
jgi:hypothetical protein